MAPSGIAESFQCEVHQLSLQLSCLESSADPRSMAGVKDKEPGWWILRRTLARSAAAGLNRLARLAKSRFVIPVTQFRPFLREPSALGTMSGRLGAQPVCRGCEAPTFLRHTLAHPSGGLPMRLCDRKIGSITYSPL